MTTYVVRWDIEIDADSPMAAADKALAIHRDPDSIATVFSVEEKQRHWHRWRVDLTEQTVVPSP